MNSRSFLSRGQRSCWPFLFAQQVLEQADLIAPFFIFRQCSLHAAGKHPHLPQADAEEGQSPDGAAEMSPLHATRR